MESGNTATPVPTPTPTFSDAISGPRTIDRSGSYYFTKNIVNSNEYKFLSIEASDVTIDGRGYTLDGIADGSQAGIEIEPGANRVTVKNLRLTDWAYGVYYEARASGPVSRDAPSRVPHGPGSSSTPVSNRNTVAGNRVTGTQLWYLRRGVDEQPDLQQPVLGPGGCEREVRTSPGRPGRSRDRRARTSSGGPSIGGNYWANPSGTGFSETDADANADGFVDDAVPGDLRPLRIC